MKEQEPMPSEAFYAGAIKKVSDLLAKAKENRLLRDETPREKIVALKESVERGIQVREFLESDFWKDHLGPFLRSEAQLRPWSMGDPLPLEEVATKYLHASGKVVLLARVMDQLSLWVKAAEEADASLQREAEKNKLATRRNA